MNSYDIRCSAKHCDKILPPELLWLPERKTLTATNGGRSVDVTEYPRHALCGPHGHELRRTGVRVYRYCQSVERAEEAAHLRSALDHLHWWHAINRAARRRYELDYLQWWESRRPVQVQ